MNDHPIQGLMQTAMESIKGMVDVNTVVGDAVETKDGTVIVPISRVSFGFAAGGTQWGKPGDLRHVDGSTSLPFGGGSGAGVSVQPVGFLVVSKENVRLLPVDERASFERLIELAPEMLDKVQGLFQRNGKSGPARENNGVYDRHTPGDEEIHTTTLGRDPNAPL